MSPASVSLTLTATAGTRAGWLVCRSSYRASLLVTLCVSSAVSLRPSSSAAALTVTVWAAFHVVVLNTRSAVGAKLTSALAPVAGSTSTVTSAVGAICSRTVYVALAPSVTSNAV